ncbi:MAG TPA: PGPGW domain-containing protein [Thermoleophilaceae bacterium]|nr:PGPGW domain-containing protein [Thermoleophilaceae bacterium]
MSTGSDSPPEQHLTLSEKLARRRERHVQRSMPYRVAFMVLAFTILLGGVALIPLPGPGWAIVFLGLGMLALEFKWAENLMEKILDRLEGAKEAAENASPVQKAFGVLATVLGIAACVAAAILWDIPLLPV